MQKGTQIIIKEIVIKISKSIASERVSNKIYFILVDEKFYQMRLQNSSKFKE
ncbi:hypothetical protein pb186bvf_021124 [Paramecium bursaria]